MVEVQIKRREEQPTAKTESQSDSLAERTESRNVFVPRTDIYEQKDALVVIADMPGVDEKSVDINVEKNVLTITGRVAAEEIPGYRLLYSEYETGDYERSFRLSNEIDVDKIEATVRQGVLRIVLGKSEAAKLKKIAVKAGA